MKSSPVQIEFYFPKQPKVNGVEKHVLVDAILSLMEKQDSLGYSGYADEKMLAVGLSNHMGNGNLKDYQKPTPEDCLKMQQQIEETVQKCNAILPIPTKNFVLVFPYIPSEKEAVFHGVMGVAPYSCVFHLFVSPASWSSDALKDTVAHELNHTIFYYHHYDDFNNYTLLDEMILEGLAENFKEEVNNTKPSPWATALTRDNALKTLKTFTKETLSSRDETLKKKVLFGGDDYIRWTGYSIGYWLVKEYKKKNPELAWDVLMKIPTKQILSAVL